MAFIIAAMLGITIYLLVLMVGHSSGMYRDSVRRRLDVVGGTKNKTFVVDEDISKPLSERIFKPLIKSAATRMSRRNKNDDDAIATENPRLAKLKKMLKQAGLGLSAAEFKLIRMLVVIGAGVVLGVFALLLGGDMSLMLLAMIAGLFVGFTGVRFYLTRAITKRRTLMERQLPDVLDLLSVSVEAGLGFEQAINHITAGMDGPLIDELVVTYREMTMGRARRDALVLLGERCDLEEMKTFVGAIVQATQLGISIKNVLRAQAYAMRQSRKSKVQEKAMKVSIKMLFPMVAFIFPVIFIILLGPAVVNVINVFSGS